MVSAECFVNNRYPDKEAGQVPMAYVVRKAGSSLSENQVMDFVAGQVSNSREHSSTMVCS